MLCGSLFILCTLYAIRNEEVTVSYVYLGESECIAIGMKPTASPVDVAADPTLPEVSDAVDGISHTYQPVAWHWFFLKEMDKTKRIWKPFSMLDSVALDDTFQLRNSKVESWPVDIKSFCFVQSMKEK